jgi:3-carboxy-cis,cis-muconate cycloisomerase
MDLRPIFSPNSRMQRYLEVEAALALAEADLGVIPRVAGEKIASSAHIELLDAQRIAAGQATTGHLMVPLVAELARVVGEPEGGWVHWGATTQNIQQTGDVLGIRIALQVLTGQLCDVLEGLAELGDRSANAVMAGRTHWQQAVPITFGFKVATWSDVLIRHLERLDQLKPRLLVSMTGGAAGTFASLGHAGPAVQEGVARRLGLTAMVVPGRNIVDQFAELVMILGMAAATASSIAEEVSRLMAVEFGEVSETLSEGDVGSSTMPQKRNAKRSGEVVIKAAQIRALVPLALEAMMQSHEVDGTRSAMMDHAVEQGCVLSGDVLKALHAVIIGIQLYPERMRSNLALSGGLITAEAVMMALGKVIGRQAAHELVHHAARVVATGENDQTFLDVLSADSRVTAHLSSSEIAGLLDPTSHTGLSASIARTTSARARAAASRHRPPALSGT